MVDVSAPGMFRQLASGLQLPYVLELPPRPVNAQFDLSLRDTDQRGALEAICRLDPSFQYSMDGPALVMWPTGDEEENSPFSRRLERFRADGSLTAALQDLVIAGLPPETGLSIESGIQHRRVSVDLERVTVRDVLTEVAAQAHVGFMVEPGILRALSTP